MNGAEKKPGALKTRDVARRFDRAAANFDGADFVHRQAATGLLERMAPMLVEVRQVVDLGAATGNSSRALSRHFRGSRVLSVDLSMNMLRRARKARSRFSRISELRADALRLPLRDGSTDVVFANMLLPWVEITDLPVFLAEANRVLRKEGLLVFSTLGPDSLNEIRQAWASVDADEHVNLFMDMHDIGDAVMKTGLREPVLDVDYLNVSYPGTGALFKDLTRAGARNSLGARRKTLTGKSRFHAMERALQQPSLQEPKPDPASSPHRPPLQLRLEIVYGHAWGSGLRKESGEVLFDVSSIGRRAR
ncbi:MAG: methyltransferase domain-containing protein [Woeseia sp.]